MMRHLEPGRKRRRPRLSATWLLWLVAAGIALAVLIEAIR
jgi:hypothetical protein